MESLQEFLHLGLRAEPVRAFGLILARLLPIATLTPLFGGQLVSRRFRFGVAVLLALSLADLGSVSLEGPYFALAVQEAVLGLALAFVVQILFELFATAGGLVDLSRGATIATLLDPLSRQQDSALSGFLRLLLLVVLVSTGAHRLLIEALAEGLAALPPGSGLSARLDRMLSPELIVGLLADLFTIAVRIAFPVLAVLLLVDAVFALANRVAPTLQAFFLSLTVRASIGLYVLMLVLAAVVELWYRDVFPRVLELLR